jgi:hypothetical protein
MKTTHQIVLTDEYIEEAQRLAIAQNTALRLMYHWPVSSTQKLNQSPKAISNEGHDDHCFNGCKRYRHEWGIRQFPFEMGCGSKTRDLLERRIGEALSTLDTVASRSVPG